MNENGAPWRYLPEDSRREIVTRTAQEMTARFHFGQEDYGIIFQGDPNHHALMEALDLIFYIEVEKERFKDFFGMLKRTRPFIKAAANSDLNAYSEVDPNLYEDLKKSLRDSCPKKDKHTEEKAGKFDCERCY